MGPDSWESRRPEASVAITWLIASCAGRETDLGAAAGAPAPKAAGRSGLTSRARARVSLRCDQAQVGAGARTPAA